METQNWLLKQAAGLSRTRLQLMAVMSAYHFLELKKQVEVLVGKIDHLNAWLRG